MAEKNKTATEKKAKMPSGRTSRRKPGETRGRKPGYNGRPTKLTPELQEEVCAAIRAGNYIEPSAIRAGVNKLTLYNWMKRAVKEQQRVAKAEAAGRSAKVSEREEPYVQFLNAVKKAEAEAEARDVAIIAKAALKQWQAAAWRLERKNYRRWGRRQLLEHTVEKDQESRKQKIIINGKEIEF